MQYFKPDGPHFVGDCMPFYHDGTFHLFYLLDENHHQGRGGLGGHQWAHATTKDLRTWTHHPLALAVEEEWEGSICTGSPYWHDGVYHAYYATRKPDWSQHLSHASSRDGIHFAKTRPLPVLPVPPGYDPQHFRDPFVFRDKTGRFQMLVTARRADYPLAGRGGCLLRLSSPDVVHWQVEEPLLIPGSDGDFAGIPECPDLFEWNGWHYLVFGLGLATHYRMARDWRGPWLRPAEPLLDSHLLSVMKTAQFGRDRRIGAAWIGTREGDRDGGRLQWGGNLVLREILQHRDGTLSTRFLPEVAPADGARQEHSLAAVTGSAGIHGGSVTLEAPRAEAAAMMPAVPRDFRLRCKVRSQVENARFGVGLRGTGDYRSRYGLVFEPGSTSVILADQAIRGVTGIRRPFDLEVICKGDIIDVCVGDSRCLINRLPEGQGDHLFWFCESGGVRFDEITVTALG